MRTHVSFCRAHEGFQSLFRLSFVCWFVAGPYISAEADTPNFVRQAMSTITRALRTSHMLTQALVVFCRTVVLSSPSLRHRRTSGVRSRCTQTTLALGGFGGLFKRSVSWLVACYSMPASTCYVLVPVWPTTLLHDAENSSCAAPVRP